VSCQVNVPAVLLLDTFLSRARDPASVFERARIDNIGARRDEAERTIRRVYLATAEMAERAVKRDLRLNRRVRVVRFVLQRVERSQAARHLVRPDERCAGKHPGRDRLVAALMPCKRVEHPQGFGSAV
jgi:hypothetical protein